MARKRAVQGYYVYGIKRDGSIIYVGKGKDGRVMKSLSDHCGDDYVIFADDLTEEEAFRHERIVMQALLNCGIELENKQIYRKKIRRVS